MNRLAGERPLLDIVGIGQSDDGVEVAIENVRENLNGSTERPTTEFGREDVQTRYSKKEPVNITF